MINGEQIIACPIRWAVVGGGGKFVNTCVKSAATGSVWVDYELNILFRRREK
jgi:hypothetical protein